MNPGKRAIALAVATSDSAIEQARLTLGLRRRRSNHFETEIFGEPGWDLLLVLFVDQPAGRGYTTAELALKIGIGQTITVRWLTILEERSLVQRTESHASAPSYTISPSGQSAMIDLFSA